MKQFKGKLPKKNTEQVGNPDCIIDQFAENIIPLVENHVHAITFGQEINSDLRPNTIYMRPTTSFRPKVIRVIDVKFGESVPNIYPELIEHMNPEEGNTNEFFGAVWNCNLESGPEISCIELKVNGNLAGYYIPNINSWIVGHWTWHEHYINIIVSYVFQKFVEKIGIRPCEHSIAAERSIKPTQKVTVSLGADPEFELVKHGEIINASSLGIRNSLSTDIGQDGSSSQIELRPRPANSAAEVTRNIRKLVSKFSNQYPDYDLTDEGDRYPLGGHIHVGLGHRIEIDRDLVQILDDFIGKPTINLSGEARGSYKSLSAVRQQPHGFEYRSTPSSIFQNAEMTYVTFKLIKNLCEKYFNEELVTYSDKPTIHDYVTVGGLSERQAKYFLGFCKNYKPVKSIVASWKIKKAESVTQESVRVGERSIPTLEFRDEWRSSVAQSVRSAFDENHGLDWSGTISLYGLNRDRGSTGTTLEVRGLNEIDGPRPTWTSNDHMNVGITADMRRYGIDRETLDRIINAIRLEIALHECDESNDEEDDGYEA